MRPPPGSARTAPPSYGDGRVVVGTSRWNGTFREGSGTVSTRSGTLRDEEYSYASRFEGAPGACPEELLAAAYAACFNQALANIAQLRGLDAGSVTTAAKVTMGRDERGPAILAIHLDVRAVVSEATAPHFQDLAGAARAGCAFSKALSVDSTMTAACSAAEEPHR